MKLSEFKSILNQIETIEFTLPDGSLIPQHFHITEVGQLDKRFIDCGSVLRKVSVINFQLYTADDFDHRLSVQKMKSLLDKSEKALLLDDLEIEIEYQSDTIGKYALGFEQSRFTLVATQTDCLAKDECVVPNISKSKTAAPTTSCTSDSCCC